MSIKTRSPSSERSWASFSAKCLSLDHDTETAIDFKRKKTYPEWVWVPQTPINEREKARCIIIVGTGGTALEYAATANPLVSVGIGLVLMSLNLHFRGPFSVCSETDDVLANCPLRNGRGIYLWAVKQLTTRYRISYLGETSKSFYCRTKEHLIQTMGGNYRVIDADQMSRGIQRIVWDGLWRKKTRDKLPDFLSNV